MARFAGVIGYVSEEEDPPGSGVWTSVVNRINYKGDVKRAIVRNDDAGEIQDGTNLNHQISVLADEHAIDHASEIKFVEWVGGAWKVTSVEIQRPRLILNVGGVYNGPTS